MKSSSSGPRERFHEFKATRAKLVRDLADQAAPFTKGRLPCLATRYENVPSRTRAHQALVIAVFDHALRNI
jgi:hypothetical protein